jgi:galactokinase
MAGEAQKVRQAFEKAYGPANGVRVFRAPGRVNLIGEHTDYNMGFVLPIAIEFACFIACSKGDGTVLRVYSENLNESRAWPIGEIPKLEPARDWGDYVAGVAREVLSAGFKIENCDLAIHSTVPVGSGLSSSAALEVSTALALLGSQNIEPLELARLCQRAERNFVGMPCGIMDQYVSVFGKENAALEIDCRSLGHKVATLPSGVAIVAVNTMVKHELGTSAYKQRVAECAAAVEAIQRRYLDVKSLRDVSSEQLESVAGEIPPVPLRRALHVVTEDERVEKFIAASAAGNLREMGDLFVASHRSLQKDYEVSCEELDALVDTALGIPGVFGARMTGGGFGGCTVNLVLPEAAPVFQNAITRAYKSRFGIDPQVYVCKPSEGAGEVE